MPILAHFYHAILDALFPLTSAEKTVLSYSPVRAMDELPPAPTPPLENTMSIFAYKDERVAKLVWNIKYKREPRAVAIGGTALFRTLEEIAGGKTTIIVPIPMTKRRRKERGYNQCELLVGEIAQLDAKRAEQTGNERKFTIKNDLLVRVHHADRQTLKSRPERLAGAKGVFAINETALDEIKASTPGALSASTAIVIDDVITTGSTMKEAMETLRAAGFEKVLGLSLAH